MNELMYCIIVVGIIGIILYGQISLLAVIKNKRNPLPKMTNGGYRFKNVNKVRTQSITAPVVR